MMTHQVIQIIAQIRVGLYLTETTAKLKGVLVRYGMGILHSYIHGTCLIFIPAYLDISKAFPYQMLIPDVEKIQLGNAINGLMSTWIF